MARLADQQKVFIVGRLACFYTPSEVREQLKQEHQVELPLSQICFYDPTTAEGDRLGDTLKELFFRTRERFVSDVQAVPIANRSYRLRRLQNLIDDPNHRRNPNLVKDALEQAAKEVGGLFTAKRELNVNVRDLDSLIERELERVASGSEGEIAGASAADEE